MNRFRSKVRRLKKPPSWEETSETIHQKRKGSIVDAISRESNLPVLHYIEENLHLGKINNILLTSRLYLDTNPLTLFNVRAAIMGSNVRAIIDFKKTNHTRYINKYFKAINSLLPDAGIYIGNFETNEQRNERVYVNLIKPVKQLKILIDFFLHRVIPKLSFTKKLYFRITKGKYRFLSKAEVLGRLVSCGFEIIDFRVIRGLTYFVVMKTSEPKEVVRPTYGPFIRLNRVGRNGKLIRVYKFRTMHPFSEFIQDFVVKMNGYTDKGKPAHDFRLTAWGKWFRKYWIDELPQIINLLKGELKIVGVRPLSKTRFNELPEDLKVSRIQTKPGCIPPYVSLNMPSDSGNIEAERIYLSEKSRSHLTDLRYFFLAMNNIFRRRIISE
ncbi:MAG: sugar transferase [Bacteroidales bacterium]